METKWYILRTQSGKEFDAKIAMEAKMKVDDFTDVEEIVVPVYKETIYKNGKKKKLEKKSYPGYICIKMNMNYETKNYVCTIPYVSGFLSNKDELPAPLPEREIKNIISKMGEAEVEDQKMEVDFGVGEKVLIVDGPFNNFIGVVKAVHPDKGKVSVDIEIFGRKTPVEIDYYKVKKH